jgi:hypothetical protein
MRIVGHCYALSVKHELYFWREERPIPPAADSLLGRLAEDRNLPGVEKLSLATIKAAFSRHFPGITVAGFGMEWRGFGVPFQVSFNFDDRNQPNSVCISSETPLVENPQVLDRILAATRELGCTRIESRLE